MDYTNCSMKSSKQVLFKAVWGFPGGFVIVCIAKVAPEITKLVRIAISVE